MQLTDRQIADTLLGWIANRNNQTPGFPQPGPNTVYVIFLPQSVSVTDNTGVTSCRPTSLPFTFTLLAGGPSNIVVSSLTITRDTVIGGATAFARFTLASAVGPGGGSIVVESSDPVASVPNTVPLAAGTTGGFQIHTTPLQRPIARKYATIMAGQDGAPAHALLTVTS